MKKSHIITLFLVLAQAFLYSSCNESVPAEPDPRYYVPLEVGRFYIYNVVEENFYSGVSQPTVRSYQEKEKIIAYKGDNLYVLARYKRNNDSSPWVKDKEYTMQLFTNRLTKTIDNKEYVDMVFPINTVHEWNGNAFNNLDEKDYQYSEQEEQTRIGNETFSNTIKVIEDNNFYSENLLELDRVERQYSYNIGLIYELQNNLQYCQETSECLGENIIESGVRKKREIVSYGTE